jgi:uncharacterized protein (DUF2461 family)
MVTELMPRGQVFSAQARAIGESWWSPKVDLAAQIARAIFENDGPAIYRIPQDAAQRQPVRVASLKRQNFREIEKNRSRISKS